MMYLKGGQTMKKLLIVVDVQNDFVDGALGFEKAQSIIKPIKEKILEYQRHSDKVVYTMDTHEDNYLETEEGAHLPVKHCLKGTKGHALHPELEPLLKDARGFIKETFPSLELGQYLKEKPFASIELVGLVSNICVLSNAVIAKAANPNAKISVDAMCTASFDDDLEQKAFDVLEGLHITVTRRKQ